jgi:hypothetical protein
MQRASLSHLNECIESDTDIVFNCSGVHARTLGGVEDPDVYPIGGQTVIVQLPRKYVNWSFLRHPPGSNTARPGLCEYFIFNHSFFKKIKKSNLNLLRRVFIPRQKVDDSIEMTYVIPRDNGEVVLGGTYVSIILYFFVDYFIKIITLHWIKFF